MMRKRDESTALKKFWKLLTLIRANRRDFYICTEPTRTLKPHALREVRPELLEYVAPTPLIIWRPYRACIRCRRRLEDIRRLIDDLMREGHIRAPDLRREFETTREIVDLEMEWYRYWAGGRTLPPELRRKFERFIQEKKP